MTFFTLGTKVCSARDRTLRGTVVGYGMLNQAGPEYTGPGFDPTPVYLVWVKDVPGSSSIAPAIRVFDMQHTESVIY